MFGTSVSRLTCAAAICLAGVICPAVPRTACADDAATSRVINGLAFCEQLRDRWIQSEVHIRRFRGDSAYQQSSLDRSLLTADGMELESAVLRSDDQVCVVETLSPFPATADSILARLVVAHGRRCNINYKGSDTQSGIATFNEGPQDTGLGPLVSLIGSGVWWGYLFFDYLPPVTSGMLEKTDWAPDPSGTAVSGQYGEWRITFQFESAISDRLSRIEISPADGRPRTPTPRMACARTIELSNWTRMADIECPATIVVWDLGFSNPAELYTVISTDQLKSVGPVIEVSDRYGDWFTDIPNGRRVQVNDYMGIDFIWQDGEIVRKVDRARLDRLVGHSFFPSPYRRFLGMTLGAAGLAAVSWFLWWKTRRSPQ